MDFDFSEDQAALRDAVRRFVDKDYAFARRVQIERTGGFDRAVWDGLAGLGLTALAVPEAHGDGGHGRTGPRPRHGAVGTRRLDRAGRAEPRTR